MGSAPTGCSLGPRNFRQIRHPAPIVRARALSLGYGQSEAVVLPSLLGRLEDPDVVVRMAANEELKQRTRRDAGFVPWSSPEERAAGVTRWHALLTGQKPGPSPTPARPRKSLPRPSPQSSR